MTSVVEDTNKEERVDYLDEDKFLPEGQKFVCLSFLTPSKEDKHTLSGIKVRAVFGDYDKACKHAKQLQELDKFHSVFVGEMGKWLPFDPDPSSKFVEDSEYANTELNKMMKAYKENQDNAKLHHEQRKNLKMIDNLEENMLRKYENKKQLRNDLKSEQDVNKKEVLKTNLKALEEQLKDMEKRKDEIKEREIELAKKLAESNDPKEKEI